jgi:AAA family ATP:ADP antiporter
VKALSDILRNTIWPIENNELKKFFSIVFIKFCFIFNYCLLRSLKDSLVVPSIGAEAISFVELWSFPVAVLFVIIYVKLANTFKPEKVFYIITSCFIGFIGIFAFIFYPNQHVFHPDPIKIKLFAELYPNFKWFILIYGQWTYAILYLIAELWGSVMISLLFWQFANQITPIEQAKRFYPLFGIFGQMSLIPAGGILKWLANLKTGNSLFLIQYSSASIIVMAFLALLTYKGMHIYILKGENRNSIPQQAKPKKKKPGLIESFRTIISSRYLGFIALIVISYYISINLIEGPWKAKVRELYPTKNEYAAFMGAFYQWTGVVSVILSLIGSYIVRKFSWLVAAMMTPIMIVVTGLGFYLFTVFSSIVDIDLSGIFTLKVLSIAVLLGSIQNILTKSTKYSLFDPVKEMAYIPIDQELKIKGKAAVDVLGTRFGKGGGAIIQSLIFMIFPFATFDTITPYLMVIFLIISSLWFYAVLQLNKEYNSCIKLSKEKTDDNT